MASPQKTLAILVRGVHVLKELGSVITQLRCLQKAL